MPLAREMRPSGERDRLLVNPRTAAAVLDRLRLDPERGADVTRLVFLDPALGAAVLRAANSAHLGYSRRISNIRQASVMLGDTLVASLAAGRVADLLFDHSPPEYPEWLWPHSLTVAAASAVLARRTDESEDDAYTAGLLHDTGWLLAASNGTPPRDDDTEHAQLGAELLARWNFPERMVGAIQQHHARPAGLVGLLDRIVVAAHGLAKALGAPSPEPALGKLESLRLVGLDVRASIVLDEVEAELASLVHELGAAS